jgi:hypothetical protein
MGFLETGFPIFSIIVIWNVLLLGFGGISDSQFLTTQLPAGINHPTELDPNSVQTQTSTGTPYIAPTTVPEQNIPFFNQVFDAITASIGFLFKLLFGAAEAIEKSSIPSPINWILSTIIYFFVTGYIAAYGQQLLGSTSGGSKT